MRIVAIYVFALGLLAGSLADDFDRKIAAFPLLQNKAVQTEILVTKAQVDKMNGFAAEFKTQVDAYKKDLLKKANNDPKKVKPDQAREATMLLGLKDKVIGILSDPQVRRLRELSLQAVGVTALGDDVVAKKVGLSAAQKTQVRGFVKTGLDAANKIIFEVDKACRAGIVEPKTAAEAKKANETYTARKKTEMAKVTPQLQKLRDGTIAKVLGVLTPAQKAVWKGLLGKPFSG